MSARLSRPEISFAEFCNLQGQKACSEWIRIDQPMLDKFADVTGDDAFIHTDPEAAAGTRFGGTIAHGLLTLSLLPFLMRSATPLVQGTRMGVNYGYDRVRFLAPVPCDARVRAVLTLTKFEERKKGFWVLHYNVAVEVEGSEQPALTAQWLIGRWIDAAS